MDKIYTIKWCEVTKKGNTNGRDWAITKMTLVDEQGVEVEGVSTFDTVSNGGTIEGQIVKKGDYLNFEKKKEEGKRPNMDRIMEKKSSLISEAQGNKARQIAEAQDRSAWMWAKTNASTILAGRSGFASQSINEISFQIQDLATKIYNCEPLEPFN